MNSCLRVSATSTTRQLCLYRIYARPLYTNIACKQHERHTHTTTKPDRHGWKPTIGLELHVQLKSPVKLFSNAPTSYEDVPNTQVASLDAAIPGTLPVRIPFTICVLS